MTNFALKVRLVFSETALRAFENAALKEKYRANMNVTLREQDMMDYTILFCAQ